MALNEVTVNWCMVEWCTQNLNEVTVNWCMAEWCTQNLNEVTVNWCMVEWCTQNLRRDGSSAPRGTSHATTTKERYQYTVSVDIKNTRCKRIQSLIQKHMRHVRSECAGQLSRE